MRKTDSKYWIVNKLNSTTAEILIYGNIGTWSDEVSANSFVKELKALEKDYTHIKLRINSGGGSVYEGIAIFKAIQNSSCTIDCYIDGIAASMASLIAMACKKVYMSKFARLMTHLPSGGAWGTAEELRAVATELDACASIANKMYQDKTGLTEAQVSSQFLNGKDNFFGADAALKAKLVDGIYDGEQVELPTDITDKGEMWQVYNNMLKAKLEIVNEHKDSIILS